MRSCFDEITLADRNLPAIAEKRLLRPKSEAAGRELEDPFQCTARVRDEVMNRLLTREGDKEMIRRMYPFSPALVQTLVAVSSLLQRERTALKLMSQLLVDHRDTLELGDVEPVTAPQKPHPILAQQVMTLCLQESGVGRHISIGYAGEKNFGTRNYMPLYSVFDTPPLFAVYYGRTELGAVHQLTFQIKHDEPITLSLGGHFWRVKHVDWKRRQVYVEPSSEPGKSRWFSAGQPLSYELCQAVLQVLAGSVPAVPLSGRAKVELEAVLSEYEWAEVERTAIVSDEGLTYLDGDRRSRLADRCNHHAGRHHRCRF